MGGEIAPEWSPTSFWRLRTSYSFLNTSLKKSPQSADVGTAPFIEGSSPRHQADIQSSFNLSKTVSLDLTYRYVGALAGLAVPAYSSADVRAAWRLSQHLELSLVGQNLLQPEHFESSSDPGPLVGIKRSAYAKITWAH